MLHIPPRVRRTQRIVQAIAFHAAYASLCDKNAGLTFLRVKHVKQMKTGALQILAFHKQFFAVLDKLITFSLI